MNFLNMKIKNRIQIEFQLSCEQMVCYNESNAKYPFNKCWRDGTKCGEGKWCQHRECVEKSEDTDPGLSYSWTIQWSECSDLCNGTQYENAYCVDESNQTVLDYLCCGYQHNTNHRPCNIDCSVGWVLAIKRNHGHWKSNSSLQMLQMLSFSVGSQSYRHAQQIVVMEPRICRIRAYKDSRRTILHPKLCTTQIVQAKSLRKKLWDV